MIFCYLRLFYMIRWKSISSLDDSPEEIASYREARKKNFPTKNRIVSNPSNDINHNNLSQSRTEASLKRKPDEVEENTESHEKKQKTNHCKWYLKGSCKKGAKCSFVHDPYV